MTVRRLRPEVGAFFCTTTCYRWLPLIRLTNLNDHIYEWLLLLDNKGISTLGYVIIPNHLHYILHLAEKTPSINQVLSNGKRFMAYEIIKRLTRQNNRGILSFLEKGVNCKEIAKGQKHRVFETSSDIKWCFSRGMLEQKLDYIHHNPVNGKWSLAKDFAYYPYSSAGFYERGQESPVPITHYTELV